MPPIPRSSDRHGHGLKRLLGVIVAVAVCALFGCRSETRRLDVRVVDSEGKPIADALFYAEAFTLDERAFDFDWGRSDSDGYVFRADGAPLEIAWKSDARLSHAAFAPGMKPAGFIDHLGRATDSAFSVILYDTSQTALDYQPVLAKMSFPFETKPYLARRLRDPSNRPLLTAFRQAYEPLISGGIPTMPEEQAKLSFLESLLDSAGAEQ